MVSLKELIGFDVEAEDGPAGRISDYLIDEKTWTVGYAVIPVGGILSGERWFVSIQELQETGTGRLMTVARSLSDLGATASTQIVTKAEEGWAAANAPSASHLPAGYVPQPKSPWRSFNAILGCHVAASDGGYGLLDDALVEPGQWSIQYLVARSYTWKEKPSVLIPTAWVKEISWAGETVNVAASLAALEREPSFKAPTHERPH